MSAQEITKAQNNLTRLRSARIQALRDTLWAIAHGSASLPDVRSAAAEAIREDDD